MSADVSVLIVAYDSRDDLERLLPSLLEQDGVTLEVIVVNNRAGDGTTAWLRERYPSVNAFDAPVNDGYAGGNNRALARATSEHVLVLNPDTIVHPRAVSALLAAARARPDALITATLLNPEGTVNARGNEMHFTGITTCRDFGAYPWDRSGVHPAPLVSGAAFIARRDALEALGGFDAAYFMYLEDADLSVRARLRGYDVLCHADALVTHQYALSMNPAKFYYLERNRLLTLLKNLERRTLARLLPALALTEAATWAFAAARGPRYVAARARGYAWLWSNRRAWLASRADVQATRRAGDAVILRDAATRLPLEQLVPGSRARAALNAIVTPLYRAARPAALKGDAS